MGLSPCWQWRLQRRAHQAWRRSRWEQTARRQVVVLCPRRLVVVLSPRRLVVMLCLTRQVAGMGPQRQVVKLCLTRQVAGMGPQRQVAVMGPQRRVAPRTRWLIIVSRRRRWVVPHSSPFEQMAVHGRPRATRGPAALRLRTGTMQSLT